jgi:hypothetical protein
MDDVLDLDATRPRMLPPSASRSIVVSARVPAHVAAWVHEQARKERRNPSQYLTALILQARDDGLPPDCRDWLTRQAAQCGVPGQPDQALVMILRHLADRWPDGARLR